MEITCNENTFPGRRIVVEGFNFERDVEALVAEFARHGYTVTADAIWHNYRAWSMDCKSGYRDDVNDCFLFTPCGCNPLSFWAENINGQDYQHTYIV